MVLVWMWIVAIAFTLAWAKWSLDRRVYCLLWYLAAVTMFIIGMVL